MIEIPEAIVLTDQLNEALEGRVVKEVIVNQSPHKFAWTSGDTDDYMKMLHGQVFVEAQPVAGFVFLNFGKGSLYLSEGIKFSFLVEGEKLPKKHQLLIEFDDHSHLVASVQMYGGLVCCEDDYDNEYYLAAATKPTPFSDAFDYDYFCSVVKEESLQKKSAKEVLTTKQRIPGLGNGVLQDILFNAGIHPKRKMQTLEESDYERLYQSIKTTLMDMTQKGGRDTEKDLFGQTGGYKTKVSKFTVDKPCEVCGTIIEKKAFMGGSVYLCPTCQPEVK